jgi:hypothetical protein
LRFAVPRLQYSNDETLPKSGAVKEDHHADTTQIHRTPLVAGAALTTSAQQARPQPASKRTIVDAQVHFWKASSPDWPWDPGVRPQLPEPFTIERALPMMDEAGVDA